MSDTFPEITDEVAAFINAQKMFFVATSPLAADGHVNVSPKGFDCFRILDPHTVAYLDRGGSGIETLSHVRENGRICLMFCAFDGEPNTMRLHGTASAFQTGEPEFDELIGAFPTHAGTRSVIRVNVTRVSDSCGWGVPLFDYRGERDTYENAIGTMTNEQVQGLFEKHNAESIDGLPGMRA